MFCSSNICSVFSKSGHTHTHTQKWYTGTTSTFFGHFHFLEGPLFATTILSIHGAWIFLKFVQEKEPGSPFITDISCSTNFKGKTYDLFLYARSQGKCLFHEMNQKIHKLHIHQ